MLNSTASTKEKVKIFVWEKHFDIQYLININARSCTELFFNKNAETLTKNHSKIWAISLGSAGSSAGLWVYEKCGEQVDLSYLSARSIVSRQS